MAKAASVTAATSVPYLEKTTASDDFLTFTPIYTVVVFPDPDLDFAVNPDQNPIEGK